MVQSYSRDACLTPELGGGADDVEVVRMHQVGAHGDVDFFHGEGRLAVILDSGLASPPDDAASAAPRAGSRWLPVRPIMARILAQRSAGLQGLRRRYENFVTKFS